LCEAQHRGEGGQPGERDRRRRDRSARDGSAAGGRGGRGRRRSRRHCVRVRKLQSLFARKLTGVTASTAAACAATFGAPAPRTSASRITSDIRNAATLTATKRIACPPARPFAPRKVQSRFHAKLLTSATQNATAAAAR